MEDNFNSKINTDFILNKKPYSHASILLTGSNFGCGSSREHAAWAIKDFGINAIIAKSFADIFYNNCFKNGILPITISEEQIKQISEYSNRKEKILINLKDQQINDLILDLRTPFLPFLLRGKKRIMNYSCQYKNEHSVYQHFSIVKKILPNWKNPPPCKLYQSNMIERVLDINYGSNLDEVEKVTQEVIDEIQNSMDETNKNYQLALKISSKCLKGNENQMQDLMLKTIHESNFSESERIQELLGFISANNEKSIISQRLGPLSQLGFP